MVFSNHCLRLLLICSGLWPLDMHLQMEHENRLLPWTLKKVACKTPGHLISKCITNRPKLTIILQHLQHWKKNRVITSICQPMVPANPPSASRWFCFQSSYQFTNGHSIHPKYGAQHPYFCFQIPAKRWKKNGLWKPKRLFRASLWRILTWKNQGWLEFVHGFIVFHSSPFRILKTNCDRWPFFSQFWSSKCAKHPKKTAIP